MLETDLRLSVSFICSNKKKNKLFFENIFSAFTSVWLHLIGFISWNNKAKPQQSSEHEKHETKLQNKNYISEFT